MRTPKNALTGAIVALTAAAALALSGCASAAGPDAGTRPADGEAQVESPAECMGVEAVVDFGELDAETETVCVDTDTPITAAAAFAQAGIELVGVETSDQFFACRVAGEPTADAALEFEGESYTADCADFGPAWAWWGLFVDAGDGWQFAQEGAETQQVEPGQSVAFAWQFGDTAEPRLPSIEG